MNHRSQNIFIALALLALLALNLQLSTAQAQGTAFTYQGQLQNTNGPVQGTYNFTFSLYATNINGTAIAQPVTNNGVIITNGLFTVAIDFGSSPWNGQTNWLQIAVETNGAATFTNLSPRQQLTPVPYAIFAETASNLNGAVSLSQLPASIVTNNEASVTLDSVTLTGNLNLESGTVDSSGTSLLVFGSLGNFFAGLSAGNATMSGADNTGIGDYPLNLNTSGSNNTAVGYLALSQNTKGSDNTADGFSALSANLTGSNNVAIGSGTLANSTNESGLVAIGYEALQANSSGHQNTAIGYEALQANAVGFQNTAIGYQALALNTTNHNTAVGYEALADTTSGNDNTATGLGALQNNTNGTFNTANGSLALFKNTSGYANTANGGNALLDNTVGNQNVAVGSGALQNSTSDSGLVAIGYQALQNDNASNANSAYGENTAIGYQTLKSDTNGAGNTAVGYDALAGNTSGANNTADGNLALVFNTSGSNNTANGAFTFNSFTGGNNNTADGFAALNYTTNSDNNTAIGYGALLFLGNGNNNIALGYDAGSAFASSEGSNIDIGNIGNYGESGITRIGTTGQQTFTYLAGNVALDNTLNVDRYGLNTGNILTNALVFGASGANPFSGEGIASKRTSGGNTNDLEFYTAYTNRMTILSSGDVGIGTTNPDALLSVNGSADKPGGGSWSTFSDGRLKDVGADFTHGLEALDAIQPVHYHYKAGNPLNLPSQPDYVGVVAQQVQGAIPEAVQRNQDGYLVVNNDPIIWTMFNAIKELDQKRATEEKAKDNEIQDLKQQNDLLAKRLDTLEEMMKSIAKQK